MKDIVKKRYVIIERTKEDTPGFREPAEYSIYFESNNLEEIQIKFDLITKETEFEQYRRARDSFGASSYWRTDYQYWLCDLNDFIGKSINDFISNLGSDKILKSKSKLY